MLLEDGAVTDQLMKKHPNWALDGFIIGMGNPKNFYDYLRIVDVESYLSLFSGDREGLSYALIKDLNEVPFTSKVVAVLLDDSVVDACVDAEGAFVLATIFELLYPYQHFDKEIIFSILEKWIKNAWEFSVKEGWEDQYYECIKLLKEVFCEYYHILSR